MQKIAVLKDRETTFHNIKSSETLFNSSNYGSNMTAAWYNIVKTDIGHFLVTQENRQSSVRMYHPVSAAKVDEILTLEKPAEIIEAVKDTANRIAFLGVE